MRCLRAVSELSNSDSDVTVQDDDDVNADAAPVAGDEEAELAAADETAAVDEVGSGEGQGEGEGHAADSGVVDGGPWFERRPSDVTVSLGRTLRCDCLVAGDQPIGSLTFHRFTHSQTIQSGAVRHKMCL